MSTAILVHSKDCNRFLLGEFFQNFTDLMEVYDTFLSTENIPYTNQLHLHSNILTGDGVWSYRLRNVLNEMKNYDNIIFFLEDMIVKHVNLEKLKVVLDWHIKNKNDATKLGVHPFFNAKSREENVAGFDVYEQLQQPYRISHQPVCIFKREFLEATIQEDVTPWEHECKTNDQLTAGKFGDRKIFCVGKLGKSYENGTLVGDVIEYYHALSAGQRIPFYG